MYSVFGGLYTISLKYNTKTIHIYIRNIVLCLIKGLYTVVPRENMKI